MVPGSVSTAVTRGVQFIHNLRTSTGSHERIAVVELFGRYSGETSLITAYLSDVDRALEQGAFALRGSAAVQNGEALVVLGDSGPARADGRSAVWQGWLLLQPSSDGIDVVPLPSTIRSGRTGR